MPELARQWFVPGDGIDRHVITGDIQRYLGNDATVRPGVGNNEHEGVRGYWVKAYRNLTSAMLADLKADSARWRQEQQQTGNRDGYVGSTTYHNSGASTGRGPGPQRRPGGDSPTVEGPFPVPSARSDRMPTPRENIPVSSVDDMDVDMTAAMPSDRRYQGRPYPQQDNRAYTADGNRVPYDGRGYNPEQPIAGSYGRPPVPAPYGQEPRFPSNFPQANGGGAPQGYAQPGYYVPVSSYDPPAGIPGRADPSQYASGPYGQPPPRNDRDPRDARDPRVDPRYQPDFADPRYAYPSPVPTVVNPRDRETVTSPPQPFWWSRAFAV
ncbi:hypothetical protein K431DRAFT_99567 [Polychaeton citri CBS 116435]|uniref:Uncharacterized protein n=1 Tax=Polychaeton citri CBS 116435 TaxID=1314669 RepID=A0A9P4QDI3_9PEZI|nr:hypothetical protein K431DRAFT_99567 [Polychaeton citri CBS 116435]